jgi:hypothetical protein
MAEFREVLAQRVSQGGMPLVVDDVREWRNTVRLHVTLTPVRRGLLFDESPPPPTIQHRAVLLERYPNKCGKRKRLPHSQDPTRLLQNRIAGYRWLISEVDRKEGFVHFFHAPRKFA